MMDTVRHGYSTRISRIHVNFKIGIQLAVIREIRVKAFVYLYSKIRVYPFRPQLKNLSAHKLSPSFID
jgi:hypothetical protein